MVSVYSYTWLVCVVVVMGMGSRQENERQDELPSYLYCVAGGSLVPVDVVVVPPSGLILPCCTVLITGHAIVQASVESSPSYHVISEPLTRILSRTRYHVGMGMWCWSHVIQVPQCLPWCTRSTFHGNSEILPSKGTKRLCMQ